MFKCICEWKCPGRVYFTDVDRARKTVFGICRMFERNKIRNTIVACDLQTRELQQPLQGKLETDWTISLCGKINVAVGSSGSSVKLWNLQTAKQIKRLNIDTSGIDLATISSDGKILFTSFNKTNCIEAWNIETGKMLYRLLGLLPANNSYIIQPKYNLIIGQTCENYALIKVWNYTTGEEIYTLQNNSSTTVTSLDIEPTRNLLVNGGSDGKVKLWDLHRGQPINVFQGRGDIGIVAISPDGKFAVVGYRFGWIDILSLKENKVTQTIYAHGRSRVDTISFIDEKRFLSGGWDSTLKLWQM